MLSLLSTFEAATVIYCCVNNKEWQLAFTPDVLKSVSDEKIQPQILMYEIFIKNAIKAEVLPALQKAKGKPANKKIFDKLEIPSEMYEALAGYDYWITLEDLFVFLEKSPVIARNYAHGREALARLLCALIDSDEIKKNSIQSLNETLAQKIESAETDLEADMELGEVTLKNCVREILDSRS